MGIRDFTKSGAFVAIVFALVVVMLPFAIEQIGETTGLFRFQAKKTITGWFVGERGRPSSSAASAAVDWERYRHDLEEFTRWAESRSFAAISLPREPVVIKVEEDVKKSERRMWSVPVSGCTARSPKGDRKGYVFISGFDHRLEEGSIIAPTETLCGYEIVFIGERSAWFRVVSEDEACSPMGVVRFQKFEFTRTDGESLVWGNRRYVAHDAFPLPSGGWLMIDSFMPPDGTVFKIFDEHRREVATILCVVIGEKGGR